MKKSLIIIILSILLFSSCNKKPSAPSCADGAHKLECIASTENHVYKCKRADCDYEEAPMPHYFEDGATECIDCGISLESQTLEFTLAGDGKSYIVRGIGSCELTHINIPSEYNGLPVTEIGEYAFSTKSSYKRYGFESVTIPSGITKIDKCAFMYCTNLTHVDLPPTLLNIGEAAFCETSLTDVVIPDSVTTIGKLAFGQCTALTNINIPEGIKTLDSTFMDCTSLSEIVLPNSLELLNGTFISTAITHIDIPDNVHTIDGAFIYSQLKSVNLGEGVKEIIGNAFMGTMLEIVTIPSQVECIDFGSFEECAKLREVIFENGFKK